MFTQHLLIKRITSHQKCVKSHQVHLALDTSRGPKIPRRTTCETGEQSSWKNKQNNRNSSKYCYILLPKHILQLMEMMENEPLIPPGLEITFLFILKKGPLNLIPMKKTRSTNPFRTWVNIYCLSNTKFNIIWNTHCFNISLLFNQLYYRILNICFKIIINFNTKTNPSHSFETTKSQGTIFD